MTEPTNDGGVKITSTENGWYLVEGDVTLCAADGSVLREGSKLFLCRCGHSKVKPFCDSSHKEFGFTDDGMGRKKSE